MTVNSIPRFLNLAQASDRLGIDRQRIYYNRAKLLHLADGADAQGRPLFAEGKLEQLRSALESRLVEQAFRDAIAAPPVQIIA